MYNVFIIVFSSSGVVSIDIELSSIDINQCDAQASSPTDGGGRNGKIDRTASTDAVKLLDFLGTHKCKPSTKVRLLENISCFPPIFSSAEKGPGNEVDLYHTYIVLPFPE